MTVAVYFIKKFFKYFYIKIYVNSMLLNSMLNLKWKLYINPKNYLQFIFIFENRLSLSRAQNVIIIF